MKKLITFCFLFFLVSTPLLACRWCFPNRISTLIQEELGKKNFEEIRVPGDGYKPDEKGKKFFKDAIYEHYPQAYVIRDIYFPIMCPAAIDVALREVVNVLSEETWFYFTDKQDRFRYGAHWERVITVCTILSKFIKRGIVDLSDLSVRKKSWREYFFGRSSSFSANPTKDLLSYFKEHGYTAYQDFYVLYFDYTLKLFNEGIKFGYGDKIRRSFYRLQSFIPHIQNSKYQAKYEQQIVTCKRLRSLFRERSERQFVRKKGTKFISPSTIFDSKKYDDESHLLFIKSIICHYDFNKQGRYTHEYHPYLLRRTANSMDELEARLQKDHFVLHGRMIISGYEEQAIPSYYTDFSKPEINDEATAMSNIGAVAPPHNIFGLMTGFLFKDFNYFANKWFKDKESPFVHINPEFVEIFDSRGSLFQQDAFGELYDLLINEQETIEEMFFYSNSKGILGELVKFWQMMYSHESRSGNNQIIGTQDILFSVEYARRLQKSPLPIKKYYTGADITYPIEISLAHNSWATHNAQDFVKQFAAQLKPVNGEKTAYVFCSFVDGVGKSTMLGNIKNFSKHGPNVKKYEHVDNSSSQLAEVHPLSDDVVIADLPAQVSHFSYKPDGYVYIDLDATTLEHHHINNVVTQVRKNREEYYRNFNRFLGDVRKIIKNKGFGASELEDAERPEFAFLKNLILLKKVSNNKWIPFSLDGENYLFRCDDPSQVRILQPLGSARSHGLKNADAAQMLFLDGVRFPLPYNLFLDDLTKKLHDQEVKNIVFVDFMSMYPRSCRENIRVNYLLQQIALLHPDFDKSKSLYSDFVDDIHLLHLLSGKSFNDFSKALKNEAELRLALYKILVTSNKKNLDGVFISQLTELIKKQIREFTEEEEQLCDDLVDQKMKSELQHLNDTYGLSKEYVNIQQLSFPAIQAFSNYLELLFTRGVVNKSINKLWKSIGYVIGDETDAQGKVDEIVSLSDKTEARARYHFSCDMKNRILLESMLRELRINWYASLMNLLPAYRDEDQLILKKENYLVLPYVVRKNALGANYVLQKMLPLADEKFMKQNQNNHDIEQLCETFGIDQDAVELGVFDGKLYPLDYEIESTNYGLFAFDNYHSYLKDYEWSEWSDEDIVSLLVREHHKQHGENSVMPTSVLYAQLSKNNKWREKYLEMLDGAYEYEKKLKKKRESEKKKNNDSSEDEEEEEVKDSESSESDEEEEKIFLGKKENLDAARIVVQALATLEMIIKDPEADIVVRKGNRDDFIAALKLFERVTLPKYFHIIFPKPLFDDYSKVEPCVSWDLLQG